MSVIGEQPVERREECIAVVITFAVAWQEQREGYVAGSFYEFSSWTLAP